jgi:class 3 adenylate cyclase/tetratricopeptide (TPR) repeat protein
MAVGAEPLVRKTVTILFCDVTGFTSLGERVDPETMRRVMLRYFDEMRTVLQRHGGTVEKFIGDAVMAIFGVPVLHEDDALRAVRAADEMRRALTRLNDELDERFGIRLEARIGINTGEVIVGDPSSQETIATGDAVNVAARLQQAAQPSEILLGRETHRLVADRVRAGPLETFSAKGKSEPVSSWRLDEVRAGAERIFRRLGSPIVGRERERDLLHAAYRTALEEQSCGVVTVLGAAGVGKTRLAQEVAARSFGATVAQGRCLPYGDGITFFPVTEIVRSLAGLSADDDEGVVRGRIAQLLPATDESSLVADRLVGLLHAETDVRSEEAFWAVRKLLEAVARSRPLVLVLEDLHWAEPTLLDLIEYLVGWSRGAPMLVLALARPDLLDLRPAWPGERLHLEPLARDDVHALLGNLLGAAELDKEIALRIETAAEGNPLFVEELVRMLVEDGALVLDDGRWVAREVGELAIPPSINALLAARLDHLDSEEQAVLQCASVIGKQFWWSAVAELVPGEIRDRVGSHLHALVRKRLVFPAESTSFVNEDSFRFGHILARDAAYAALPKARRAVLHERFADWLDRNGAYEEIRGHHLERAYLARSELGPIDDEARALGSRAFVLLASAGRRALARGDVPAAVALLSRAAELPAEDDAARLALVPDLANALTETGELARAYSLLTEAMEEADRLGERGVRAHAAIFRAYVLFRTDATSALDETQNVAETALATFSELGDERGLARASRLLSLTHGWASHWRAMGDRLEDALDHLERVDDPHDRPVILTWLAISLYYGPTPVPEAVDRIEAIAELIRPDRVSHTYSQALLAGLLAMQRRFGEADELIARCLAMLEELDVPVKLGHVRRIAADVHLQAGRPLAAEQELRLAHETLDRVGDRVGAIGVALELADVLYAQARYAEAEEWFAPTREALERSDVMTCVTGLGVQAKLLARAGSLAEAKTVANRAVTLADSTDALTSQARVSLALADVLSLDGNRVDARAAVAEAVERFDAKGDLAGAGYARKLMSGVPARA